MIRRYARIYTKRTIFKLTKFCVLTTRNKKVTKQTTPKNMKTGVKYKKPTSKKPKDVPNSLTEPSQSVPFLARAGSRLDCVSF